MSSQHATPAALGYRLPAEWEPHLATFLAWPHRRATWLGDFSAVPPLFARIARTLAAHEPVRILAAGEPLAAARAALAGSARLEQPGSARLEKPGSARESPPEPAEITFEELPTNDAWVRDTGPVFLLPRAGSGLPPAAVAFGWNAWGGKYPPWDDDARVADTLAHRLGLPVFAGGMVLEGGAIETDGDGTLLVNERCVIDPRRNPGLDRAAAERLLSATLGVERVLWTGGELAGDDTDGHIDQLARFVAPGRVLVARQGDPLDPNHGPLEANLTLLRSLVDARGRRLEVVPVDLPARFAFENVQLPASHLNYLVGNGFVAVPVFGGPTDERALATLGQAFPGRAVVPVECGVLVRGRGGLHCITRDQPAVGLASGAVV